MRAFFLPKEKAHRNGRPLDRVMQYVCGAGCLPVSCWMTDHSSRSLVSNSADVTVTNHLVSYAPPHRGIHQARNLTSEDNRFNALRRCDRGTDAMHLANTPVGSPESKNPARAGFLLYSNCRFLSLPGGAALPSMNELSNFLARFQYPE